MGQKKGKTGNPDGRPKGTANKITTDLRAKINLIVEKQFETIESDLQSLEPKERLMIIEKLIAYCVPKLQTVESKTDLSGLSDSQLEYIIDKINSEK